MGRVIKNSARAADILRDVRLTLKTAELWGAPYHGDATEFLGHVLASVEETAALRDAAHHELEDARLEQATTHRRTNDRIAAIKDDLYNAIGRKARDPVFMQIFPGGCRRYTALPPAEKAGVLEHLANLLESLPHPSIPRPRVDALTAELRAAAPVMAAIARRVDEARTALRLISARYYALARFGATQLSMLKRLWVARGLSEADVHRLIPHHPAKAPSEEA